MGHGIEESDAVLYAIGSDAPWHDLAKPVDPSIPLEKMADEHGLGWKAVKEQLYRVNRQGDRPLFIPVEGEVAIVREDTDTVLGTATNDYKLFQNSQGFASLQPILDSGMARMDVVGSVLGGRHVWGTLRIHDAIFDVADGDNILRNILFSWSHDGKTGLRFGLNDVRVVCQNTLRMAWRSEVSKMISISHRGNVQANVDLIVNALNVSTQEFKATAEDYKKMLNKNINQDDIRKYVKVVLQIEEKENNKRASNIIDKVTDLSISGRGNKGVSGTVWAAFNGVTEYLSHIVGRNADNRLASLWWGQNGKVLARAHDEAMKLAE